MSIRSTPLYATAAVADGGAEAALGRRIRSARTRRGLSAAELANLAGVSKSLVSQIERGIAAPSIDTVRRLASALELPVFSLFMEEPDAGMVVRRADRRVGRYPGSRARREGLRDRKRTRLNSSHIPL